MLVRGDAPAFELASHEDVFSAMDACWLAYARFMGRLPPEEAVAEA